jgi:hypothetical protein
MAGNWPATGRKWRGMSVETGRNFRRPPSWQWTGNRVACRCQWRGIGNLDSVRSRACVGLNMTETGLIRLLKFASRQFLTCATTVSIWLICPVVCDWMRAASSSPRRYSGFCITECAACSVMRSAWLVQGFYICVSVARMADLLPQKRTCKVCKKSQADSDKVLAWSRPKRNTTRKEHNPAPHSLSATGKAICRCG